MKQTEQEYAKSSFNDVANQYDQIAFFKTSAQNVVKLIQHRNKQENIRVLDVACGTGNVVIECARKLHSANFEACDIAEGMLDKARDNALNQHIRNIHFFTADITQLSLNKKYDVITCSYALFFLPKAHNVLQKLHQLLTDSGFIIFTSFTDKEFSPVNDIILSLLRKHGSTSALDYVPSRWQNLRKPQDIQHLCKLAKVDIVEITKKVIRYPMSINQWWELLNNTGFKGMLLELTPQNYRIVKSSFYEQMTELADKTLSIELNADSHFCIVNKTI
ncbi:MAG TPA: methyltransferase domain-containing protein [Thiomicrospira sp.]|jgi:ubiquinone/menaquinone biosynthesis C-methylase UbiE|nr:methyltransferase domain-containing protein [Thiomicrospira sp.]